MISIESISKNFGKGVAALQDLTLSIKGNEFIALVGESGSGKTTLLRIIAGLEQPSSGTLRINQQTVCDAQVFVEPPHRGVGLVFQNYALFPHLDVYQNITFGLNKWPNEQKQARIKEVLDLVGLSELKNRYPHQLSGGQQQRAAIARALAPKPDILLLDEPFSNLDTLLKEQVRTELRQIVKASGLTAILVTHDIQDALSMADRIALLKSGSLQQFATPETMYQQPQNSYVASFLGKANILPARYQEGFWVTDVWKVKASTPKSTKGNLVVRPHQVRLCETGGVTAVLQAEEHFGGHKLLKFSCRTHQLWCDATLNPLVVGNQYQLDLDGSPVHVMAT